MFLFKRLLSKKKKALQFRTQGYSLRRAPLGDRGEKIQGDKGATSLGRSLRKSNLENGREREPDFLKQIRFLWLCQVRGGNGILKGTQERTRRKMRY